MRIAAAQAHPIWGRPGPGAERVAAWIGRAGEAGVDLLAFGETHLGGYPFWLSMTVIRSGAVLRRAAMRDACSVPLTRPRRLIATTCS